MVTSKGRCKICGHTVKVGNSKTPPDIAAEGVMEGIQEHIFQNHCGGGYELVGEAAEEFESVFKAWEHV